MEKLVSIIVPVYNVETYLKQCIESLIAQTYKNIEIILIDDGSSDSSGSICDDFCKQDNRIVVVHKQNGGVADSRNSGIKAAKGDIITFVDSDDFVSSEYVSALLSIMERTNVEISMVGYYDYCDGRIENHHKVISEKISSYQAIKALASENLRASVWGFAYKRHLFQDVHFPQGRVYEDFAASWKLINKTDFVGINTSPYYYYRKTPQSIMNGRLDKRVMDIIFAHEEFANFLKQNHPEILPSLNARLIRYCTAFLYRMQKEGYENRSEIKVLQRCVKDNIGDFLTSRYSLSKKIYALTLCYSLQLAKVISKVV